LPIEKVLIHEKHDSQRANPLIMRIRSSGVFRNPPIVAPLKDGSDRYMVLDGANRVTALREMNCPHVLVQLIQPDDPGLILKNWNHVIWEYSPSRFIQNIGHIPNLLLRYEQNSPPEVDLFGECSLALVQDCRGRYFSICCKADSLKDRVAVLNAVVESYLDKARLDRTNIRDINQIKDVYPYLCGMVIFPEFEIQDLMILSSEGFLLPAGVTRFSISPRALHLNYPIEELFSVEPIEIKNIKLHAWIQERIAKKQVRYYSEPTYLFDE
jgi:hypothetical protein